MKKNEKNLLPLLLVALFSVIVIFLIVWIRAKNPKPVEVATSIPQNKPVQENPNIFFASNGKNTVYKIKKGNQWSVIWNGQEGKSYDFVSNPVFSDDGSQIAYNAEINGQAYVVINNNQEINAYQKANYITFSKNGNTIAFVATKNDGSYVVINADIANITDTLKESHSFKEIALAQDPNGNSEALILSDDGKKVAYVIKEDDKVYVVVNGQKSQGFDDVISFTFSEDGSTFSYEAQNGNTVLTIVNNRIVSSSTNNPSPSNQDTTNNNSSVTYPSATYRYKATTTKDAHLDENRFDYSNCSGGGKCNF